MVLELRDVGKVFARGERLLVALDRVSLTVGDGDCVAVYGTSRSGKSTLLRLSSGAETPTSGSILYDGQDLNAMDERQRARLLRSEVSWVPASPDFQPGLSVLEQVALSGYLGSRDYGRAKQEAGTALQRAGIEHCAEAQPGELSDGELRLTAIAQALVKAPRLLLADEPAANLDPTERDRVLDLLCECAAEHGSAVLFTATHADETLRSTSLVRLDCGRLTVPSAAPPRGEVIELAPRRAVNDRSRA